MRSCCGAARLRKIDVGFDDFDDVESNLLENVAATNVPASPVPASVLPALPTVPLPAEWQPYFRDLQAATAAAVANLAAAKAAARASIAAAETDYGAAEAEYAAAEAKTAAIQARHMTDMSIRELRSITALIAINSSNAVQSRVNGGSFDSFVGTWSLPSDDGDWIQAATAIETNFNVMLNESLGDLSFHELLNQLVQHRWKTPKDRREANCPPKFEGQMTHPFVFRVLNKTTEPLQALLATLLPSTNLHLYTKGGGMMKNTRRNRNTHAMLFLDAESTVTVFDARARQDGCLAVEAKRWLDQEGKSDALGAGERNFAVWSGDVPSVSMRVGTSLFTDGVDWFFARMMWRRTEKGDWVRHIKISPKIDVSVGAGGWELLARWFAFAFHEAVTKPREPTGLPIKWKVGDSVWRLADAQSSGDRSVVSRWRVAPSLSSVAEAGAIAAKLTADADSVVVKFIAITASAERRAVLQRYADHERDMLRKFAAVPSFVHASALLPPSSIYLAIEDGGAALASFNIRGAAGRALAQVVHRDIWVGALAALLQANLCHFDITENNIVIHKDAAGAMHAKLIDLESVTEEGHSAEGSPTATTAVADPTQRPLTATHAFDQQCVCAVLQCLWETEVSSFAKRAQLVPTFADENARTTLIDGLK